MADETDDDVREVSSVESDYRCWYNSPANTCQRLKAALWFAIGKMADEETLKRNRNATPQFIGSLTELVLAQIGKNYS
jgi:hypothetical protein